jgi:hypothetical protein
LGSRRQHFKEKLLNTDRIQVGRDMISSLWSGMKELLNKILAGVGKVTGLVSTRRRRRRAAAGAAIQRRRNVCAA